MSTEKSYSVGALNNVNDSSKPWEAWLLMEPRVLGSSLVTQDFIRGRGDNRGDPAPRPYHRAI